MKNYFSKEFLDKYYFYILIFILFFSAILRILYLGGSSMWIDETISSIVAKNIVENGYPQLDSGQSYTRALFFHYLCALMLIFSKSEFAIRSISVLFGVLTVYLAYLFGRKFLKEEFLGIIFAFLIAVSSVEIFYSKQARFYQLFQFLYFLSFFLFYKFVILKEKYFKKKIFNYLILILVIILTIDTHLMGILIIPLFSIIYFINFIDFKTIEKFKESILKKDILILFMLNFLFILFIFIVYGPLLNFNKFFEFGKYLAFYLSLYQQLFPILILSVIGMVIGLYKDFKFNLSLILFVLFPVLIVVFLKYFATRYIYFSFFILFFYLTYLISQIRFKIIFIIVLLVLMQGSIFDINGIKDPLYDKTMPYADYKNASEFILSNYNLENINITSSWPAAIKWYTGKSNYWIYFSIDGQISNKWQIAKNGNEVYTNSKIIYTTEEFAKNTLVILETKNKPKINFKIIDYVENSCEFVKKYENIEIYYCK